jgi:hypothetical protein
MPPMNQYYPPVLPRDIRDQMDAVIGLLKARGALRSDNCPECGVANWNIDFIGISATPLRAFPRSIRTPEYVSEEVPKPPPPDFPYTFTVQPPSGAWAVSHIPVCSFVCTNCGYMKLHNLHVLGLTR